MRLTLQELGIAFEQEYRIRRFSIDFFLVDLGEKGIALEVDGLYWHQDTAHDARRDAFLVACGIPTIRIADTELHCTDVQALIRAKLRSFLD